MKNIFILSLPLLFINTAFASDFCSQKSAVNDDCIASISDLHPTQISVGMIEVKEKEKKIAKMSKSDIESFEEENPEPTVVGPKGKLYIIDHHHLGRALWDQHIESTHCKIMGNFSNLSDSDFWKKMNANKWVYTYDENGKGPLPISSLPSTVADLKDDPYRSLAGAVRQNGGYNKTTAPFAEFLWANFFRTRIKVGHSDKDFDKAVDDATKLAHSKDAKNLPGYSSK